MKVYEEIEVTDEISKTTIVVSILEYRSDIVIYFINSGYSREKIEDLDFFTLDEIGIILSDKQAYVYDTSIEEDNRLFYQERRKEISKMILNGDWVFCD